MPLTTIDGHLSDTARSFVFCLILFLAVHAIKIAFRLIDIDSYPSSLQEENSRGRSLQLEDIESFGSLVPRRRSLSPTDFRHKVDGWRLDMDDGHEPVYVVDDFQHPIEL